ncbi:MAG: ATP--guanido phosphotransferase [Sumerlaeia bacterium]
MSDYRTFDVTDRWLDEDRAESYAVLTSRARFARNLEGFPFVPHSGPDVLERVDDYVSERLRQSDYFGSYERIELAHLSETDRAYLKESRLIPKEMERGAPHSTVFLSPDGMASILINEEDHIRAQILAPGLDVEGAVSALGEIDDELSKTVAYAWSEKFGYLTACPTNLGTGLRASAMLHLPGLTLLQEVDQSLRGLTHYGLTVRGFEGENSDFLGDFFQISNEATLGKSVDEIVETLVSVIKRIVEREEEARANLFAHHASAADDAVWRSYAVLRYARKMDTNEALRLLSRLRLGIERDYFQNFTHKDLNRLVIEVQPAHLERKRDEWEKNATRDEARARHLRSRMQGIVLSA